MQRKKPFQKKRIFIWKLEAIFNKNDIITKSTILLYYFTTIVVLYSIRYKK